MIKKIFLTLIIFIIGGVGGILLPSVFDRLTGRGEDRPMIINKTEQIIISQDVATEKAYQKNSASLVSIVSSTGKTAVVMAQSVNATYRIIDYHEDSQHTVDWHIAELNKRGYVWGTDWLPHDAESTNLPAGGRTVAKIMRGLNRNVRVLPRRPVEEGHIACKTIFGQTWIDKNKCADLMQCLNRYRYEVDEETGLRSKKPEDSIWKHGADAFRTLGMAIQEEQKPKEKPRTVQQPTGAQGWMG